MTPDRRPLVAWIASEILPHEAIVRHWLIRRWGHALEADDVIQEAYCRLYDLKGTAHIRNPRAYFFTTVRTVAIDMLRAAKVVNADRMTEIDWESVMDDGPSPERVAEARQELLRVQGLLARLPATCREVIELRRLHGLPQAEVARRLGVSESVVENHVVRGVRKLLRLLVEPPATNQVKGESGWNRPFRTIEQTSRPRDGRRAWRTEK